jgi:hypothetical protein
MSYDLDKAKWVTANNMIKNTIEPAFVGSIPDDDTVPKCLKRINWLFNDLCHPADKAFDYREVYW